jgi:hypothetical protein
MARTSGEPSTERQLIRAPAVGRSAALSLFLAVQAGHLQQWTTGNRKQNCRLLTLVLLAVLNFTSAAGATAPIILLASRETMTLSLLALELSSPGINNREAASIISIFIIGITITGALMVRALGLRLGGRHDMAAGLSAAPAKGIGSKTTLSTYK